MTEPVNPRSTVCLGIVLPKKTKASTSVEIVEPEIVPVRGFHTSSENFLRPDLKRARAVRRRLRRDSLGGLGIWMRTEHGLDDFGWWPGLIRYEALIHVSPRNLKIMSMREIAEIHGRTIRPRWSTISRDLQRSGYYSVLLTDPDAAMRNLVVLDPRIITSWKRIYE